MIQRSSTHIARSDSLMELALGGLYSEQAVAGGVTSIVCLPDTEPVVQLDEPLLPAVLAGGIATASGLSRLRAVEPPEVSDTISYLVERLADTSVLVHCCAADPPVGLLHGAGVAGVLVDLDQLDRAAWDAVGAGLEQGLQVGLGALPTSSPRTPDEVARRVLRAVEDLGIDPGRSGQLLVTPACGLAGLTGPDAVRALRTVRTAADIVTDQLAS